MMLRRGPWPWRVRLLPTPRTLGRAYPRPPMPQVGAGAESVSPPGMEGRKDQDCGDVRRRITSVKLGCGDHWAVARGAAQLPREAPSPRPNRGLETPALLFIWRQSPLLPAGVGTAHGNLSQILCVKLCGNLKYYQSNLYSTVVPPDEITVNYRHGLPLITLTLPSRKERCQFVVKPMLTTVGSFLQDLQNEDKGIKTAAIFTAEKLSREQTTEMENMKSLVHRLFTALHLEEFQKKREHHLLEKIDHLKGQLQPLEQMKAKIEDRSEAKTSGLLWAGLAVLSVQGGAMAWLTWWVYSWDIMEPVTYFITFANSMVFFAYFIVTRQDYTYSAVKSRQFLHFFHKKSKQQHFDVVQYNQLKEDLAKATEALRRVRHSLYLQMPVEELNEKK
ncbi:calcium uniporter regulatory subunit MCUb, mitochondrial isoform X2 [Camelus ferus]|uniref:Calcium uniporter protein n=1 Tax=Camelus ferus TaxID=419612 RepID=A0A8B8RKA3_CAMFR|nr:calcium uniporter regulatory subunit MCUb, mitochondrial isoform X2 [Camelus ferus]